MSEFSTTCLNQNLTLNKQRLLQHATLLNSKEKYLVCANRRSMLNMPWCRSACFTGHSDPVEVDAQASVKRCFRCLQSVCQQDYSENSQPNSLKLGGSDPSNFSRIHHQGTLRIKPAEFRLWLSRNDSHSSCLLTPKIFAVSDCTQL